MREGMVWWKHTTVKYNYEPGRGALKEPKEKLQSAHEKLDALMKKNTTYAVFNGRVASANEEMQSN